MEKACETCVHFRQHYIKRGGSYVSLRYGHCVHPRVKHREAETPACQHFRVSAALQREKGERAVTE